ncbi:MAG: low temperature requirement protein A [Actinomycetota bacterium]
MSLTKWQPLADRNEVDEEGGVGWLELFFDLVYVAALIQFGDRLAEDVSWQGIARFAGTFVILWWTWTGTTAFMNRYAVDDVFHRLLTFAQMFAVGFFAVLATGPVDGRTRWMALAYVMARLPLMIMYLRVRNLLPGGTSLTNLLLPFFATSSVIWLVSMAVPVQIRYWMWAGALLLEFTAPLIGTRKIGLEGGHEEHLRERYALFTIIVLGETFVKTLSELSTIGISIHTQVYGALGFVMLVALWWTYFDDVAESHLRKRSVLSKRPAGNRILWVYTHLPLAAALTAFGVGSKKVIGVDAFTGDLKTSYAWLLSGALVVALLSVAVLDLVTTSPHYAVDSQERVGPRLMAAAAVAAIGALLATGTVDTVVGIAAISVVVVAQIAAEVVIASRRERRLEARMDADLSEAAGTCHHLAAATMPEEIGTHACDECVAHDQRWVQLRVCLTCGYVGCCDDTPGRHATRHFEETGHATMATLEPGGEWAWCYLHEVMDEHWDPLIASHVNEPEIGSQTEVGG